MSPNHNGVFQVLCGDGSVRVFVSRRVPGLGNDDLYRNERGLVAAGCSPSDTVLGPSEAKAATSFARRTTLRFPRLLLPTRGSSRDTFRDSATV